MPSGVGRIVRRGDFLETLERGDHALVGGHAAGEVLAEDGLEADAVQIGRERTWPAALSSARQSSIARP
jgi:hypothetical protein